MTTGAVYVLTNIAMPGLVKVGCSWDAQTRAEQLSSASGVPCDFSVFFEIESDDMFDVEATAHAILQPYRVNEKREFFYARPERAMRAVQVAALMSAWNKASAEARQEFLARIDVPVMDRSAA